MAFDSLDAMLGASDAAVLGVVSAVRTGEPVVSEGGDRVDTVLMSLDVTRVVRGDLEGSQDRVALEEQQVSAVDETGVGAHGLATGDEGLFFLWRRVDRDGPVYRVVNSQGFILVDDIREPDSAETLRTSRLDGLSEHLEAEEPAVVIQRLEESHVEPGMDKESILTSPSQLREYEEEERRMREGE